MLCLKAVCKRLEPSYSLQYLHRFISISISLSELKFRQCYLAAKLSSWIELKIRSEDDASNNKRQSWWRQPLNTSILKRAISFIVAIIHARFIPFWTVRFYTLWLLQKRRTIFFSRTFVEVWEEQILCVNVNSTFLVSSTEWMTKKIYLEICNLLLELAEWRREKNSLLWCTFININLRISRWNWEKLCNLILIGFSKPYPNFKQSILKPSYNDSNRYLCIAYIEAMFMFSLPVAPWHLWLTWSMTNSISI